MSLSYYLKLCRPPGARVVTQSGVTGEIFLNFLKNRLNGTVKDLEYMLEQCSLEEPLYLFREQSVKLVKLVHSIMAKIIFPHLF